MSWGVSGLLLVVYGGRKKMTEVSLYRLVQKEEAHTVCFLIFLFFRNAPQKY